MALVVNCPCGAVIRAEGEDELVRLVQDHAKTVHNQTATREEALAMARRE